MLEINDKFADLEDSDRSLARQGRSSDLEKQVHSLLKGKMKDLMDNRNQNNDDDYRQVEV